MPVHLLQWPADLATVLGVAGLIVTALGSARVSAALKHEFFGKLGQIPYGIYLYHLPILFFLYHLVGAYVPLVAIFAATLVLTYGLARLSRRAIEVPAAAFAHRLTSRHRSRRPVLEEVA